jgi:hypothetical protein
METALYQIIKDFGFPVFCTCILGIVVWKLYLRLDAKLDAANTYIRDVLHKTATDYSHDQKALVGIIRELHPNYKPHDKSILDNVNPHDETAKIIASIRSPH